MADEPIILAESPATPIRLVDKAGLQAWRAEAGDVARNGLDASGFKAEAGALGLLPSDQGRIAGGVFFEILVNGFDQVKYSRANFPQNASGSARLSS